LALAMSPPKLLNLHSTVMELKEVCALLPTVQGRHDREDGDLTVLGELCAILPLDIKLGKLVVLGHIFNVLEDSIILAAGLTGKSIFTAPFDARVQAYKNKLYWADRTFSDCFAIHLAYSTWDKFRRRGQFAGVDGVSNREADFCKDHFLQKNQLLEMRRLIEEITSVLKNNDIEPLQIQNPEKWDEKDRFVVLRLVIFGAFYPNYFLKGHNSELEQLAHRTLQGKDPRNTVYFQGFDESQASMGQLYGDQVKRIVEAATTDKDKISLTFEGKKIFMEFERELLAGNDLSQQKYNLTGDVLHQVYVAVKMRNEGNLRKRPTISLYSREYAMEKMAELESMKDEALMNVLARAQISQAEPPGPEVSKFEVVVVHVNSPGSFWVHYKDNWEDKDWEERLQFSIGELASRGRLRPADRRAIKKGEVYLVQWSEEGCQELAFYRARVVSLNDRVVSLFFIDYGNVDEVGFSKIMCLPEDVAKDYPNIMMTPGLALECRIAEVQPNRAKNSKKEWDNDVRTCFKDMLEKGSAQGRLFGEVYSVVRSGNEESKWLIAFSSLKIVKTNHQDEEVRTLLLKEHLVEPSVEPYISKKNHQERKDYAHYDEAMQEHLKQFTKPKVVVMPNFATDPSKQDTRVTLTGPFSPLEHKVMCAHRHGSSKVTNMDPGSVNVVMLDQSPGDPCDQWMVAAHVGSSPNGENLLARNTSWLPSRPGFGALAIMMFAPLVELRHNKELTRLTGFISGLGPKLWRNRSDVSKEERTHAMYPEHDIECRFDCDVTLEDINNVNKVRYYLNVLLSKGDDGMMTLVKPKALDSAHRQLKGCLKELLEVTREFKERNYQGREYRWNLVKQGLRMPSETYVKEPLLKLIDGIRLERGESIVEKRKLEMVIELWKKASRTNTNLLDRKETCPCSPGEMFETPSEIFLHLKTERHVREETKLFNTQCG